MCTSACVIVINFISIFQTQNHCVVVLLVVVAEWVSCKYKLQEIFHLHFLLLQKWYHMSYTFRDLFIFMPDIKVKRAKHPLWWYSYCHCIFFGVNYSGMITCWHVSTTGTWRTKHHEATRRTTSLSWKKMVFITMSLKHGRYSAAVVLPAV